MNRHWHNNRYFISPFLIGLVVSMSTIVLSCSKSTDYSNKSLYPPAPKFTIQFLSGQPSLTTASPGDQVTFRVLGLNALSGYTFYINQVKATIDNVTDSLITVTIPANASSGPASVVTSAGQYVYGPVLKISGKVSVDPTFKVGSGTNGMITSVAYTTQTAGPQQNYILTGLFSNYNTQSTVTYPINNIVMISNIGTYQNPSSTSITAAGKGVVGGEINSILQIPGGQYLIGGVFSSYNDINNLGSITRLNSNLSIDSTIVPLVNPDPDHFPENSTDTVGSFNANFGGSVVKIFSDPVTGGYDVLGNFGLYYSYYYLRSEKGTLIPTPTIMRNFVRLSDTATLDSTYNYNPSTGQSFPGLNGFVVDAIQLSSGQIVFVGSFTSFNGQSANGIAALTSDGLMDQSFGSAIGSGADGGIYRITYNSTLHKILVTGNFKHFNGVPANGIVMLNEDGSVDNSFVLRQFGNGTPNYAGQLNNGQIIVSGNFSTYDNIVRQGFMVLNADGSLASGYNNTGSFSGQINGIVEGVNDSGQRTVLLYGFFNLFDNTKAGNIIRILM